MKEAHIRWECFADRELEQIAQVMVCIILGFVCSKDRQERDKAVSVQGLCDHRRKERQLKLANSELSRPESWLRPSCDCCLTPLTNRHAKSRPI